MEQNKPETWLDKILSLLKTSAINRRRFLKQAVAICTLFGFRCGDKSTSPNEPSLTIPTNVYDLPQQTTAIAGIVVTIEFNHALDPASLDGNIFIRRISDRARVAPLSQVYNTFKVDNSDRSKIVAAFPKLDYETQYELCATDDIHDWLNRRIDGDNDGQPGGDFVYPFSTPADDSAPTLIAKSPSALLGVSTGIVIEAKFDEAIELDGLDAIMLTSEGEEIQGEKTYQGNTIKLKPASNLENWKQYTVTLDGSKIKDSAGNPYNKGNTYSWSFTTELSQDQQRPKQITDFSGRTGDKPKETVLSWTVPEDLDSEGNDNSSQLRYDIWRSTSQITNEGDLEGADSVRTDYDIGKNKGETHEETVENPDGAEKYFYAIKAKDSDGNESGLYVTDDVVSKGITVSIKNVKDLITNEYVNNDKVVFTNGDRNFEAYTDTEGNAELEVNPGKHSVAFSKGGLYQDRDRTIGEIDIQEDLELTERRINTEFPWDILNEITRNGNEDHPIYRWNEAPTQIIYNTSTENMRDEYTPEDEGYEILKDLVDEQIKPALKTELFPEGFFNDIEVVKQDVGYQMDGIPGKILVQYNKDQNLTMARETYQTGEEGSVAKAVIAIKDAVQPSANPQEYKEALLHELAGVLFSTKDYRGTENTVFHSNTKYRRDVLEQCDKDMIKAVYSRPAYGWTGPDHTPEMIDYTPNP